MDGAVTLTWSVPGAAVLNVTANDFLLANFTAYNNANKFTLGKNFALWSLLSFTYLSSSNALRDEHRV